VRPIVSHAVRITSMIVTACKMCREKFAGVALSRSLRTGGGAEEARKSGVRRGGPYVGRAISFVSHYHIGHMICVDRLGIVVAIEIACCPQGPLAHVLIHVVLQTLHTCCASYLHVVVDAVAQTLHAQTRWR